MTEWIEERDGDRYFVSDDSDDALILDEIYRRNVYRIEPRLGMTIMDVGAHKGIFSVWAARRGASVTAYEANPQTFNALRANLKLNSVSVDAFNFGVWSRDLKNPATMFLHTNVLNAGSSSFLAESHNAYSGRTVPVHMVAFDDILGDKEWDAVKIDVEGSEYEILSTSKKLSQVVLLTGEIHTLGDWPDESLRNKMIDNISRTHDIELTDSMIYATRRLS